MNLFIIFVAICTSWVISELAILILVRSKKNSADRDEGSIIWLNATIYTCVTTGITVGFLRVGQVHLGGLVVYGAGMVIILLGIVIRWTAILTLRKYFTANVVIQSDHRLITSGIYRLVRHPSYIGSIISFCGLGVAFSNWISFLVLVVPITFVFIKRLKLEERALEDAFGEEYQRYQKSSWALCPWIY
jgi:protein-S-isoprenylcysteine O-methyltransferase Ste14